MSHLDGVHAFVTAASEGKGFQNRQFEKINEIKLVECTPQVNWERQVFHFQNG